MAEGQDKTGQDVINPFITKIVECPICNLASPQRRIKRHLYHEQKRDIDLRPLSYQWRGKVLAVQHPLIHYLWHCPGCRFTAWPVAWENPTRGLGLTLAKYRAALRDPSSQYQAGAKVQRLLLAGLKWPELDFEQGLRLHLLAAHQLLKIQQATGVLDSLNLARYYLRLSWLFRELAERPELSPILTRLDQLTNRLASLWPEAPLDDAQALRAAVANYEIGATSALAVEDVDELCKLLLLITRIHSKLRQFPQAKLYLSKAAELPQNLTRRKQQMEAAYYQLEQRTRSDVLVVAQMARQQIEKVSTQIVELDSKARGLRFKVQEVRDLLQDEIDNLPARQLPPPAMSKAGGEAEEVMDLDLSLKPKKKKLRDYFS